MTAELLKKGATYDDVREAPDLHVAEILDGDLYASPHRALPHINAASVLGGQLGNAFHRHGSGGWVILDQIEIHLGKDVLVPDLAGWRRERMPRPPPDAYLTLAPDWVCEILSPSTEALDRGKKLQRYAREGVGHVWLIEPLKQTLEWLSLVSGKWSRLAVHEGRANVRVPPFDAIELELGALWI
jgi:Uma2 family endonuclease